MTDCVAGCRPQHVHLQYIHIMYECISNASGIFLVEQGEKKKQQSPCLSDMQRRLNRLMNSQVALQGLDHYPPLRTYQTHIHLHTH